ncbi:hypothetical protein ABN034_26380 [Actinopolymorpha sp. B11F2]|uniref:hypothetical protein n=1 Tax=Actinopolymorpha sp. B11F2 TaxID=3160862 RepID=UPI0032E4EDC0
MATGNRPAVDWLLGSDEPAIRFLTRRDVLGEAAAEDASEIMSGPKVSALLSGQRDDGAFRGEPGIIRRYRGNSRRPEDVVGVDNVPAGVAGHWKSTQWRLVSLVELAIPPGEPRAVAAANYLLNDILDRRRNRFGPKIINGLPRMCVSAEGAALVIGSRLGMAADPRVQQMAEALLDWQWPDGGWNCHRNASGRRSNFHESINAAWGLHEYAQATSDTAAAAAADRTAELYLQHRLFYSLGTGIPSRFRPHPPPAGQVINTRWLKLGYPSYWHYDILAVLMLLARIGRIDDARASDALDLLERKRRPDGLWAADRQWWTPPESRFAHQHEVVDWGRAHQPSEMITLHVLRILRAARRLTHAGVG